jgi:NAD(P)H-flavin reductase
MSTATQADPTPRPGAMLPARHRVVATRRELADTVTLELEPIDGDPLEAAPGQFTMLYAFGCGEVPISISRVRPGRLVHTIRGVGPVSRRLAASAVGDVIGVRGPFGSTWPVRQPAGADVVIVAGGIGLAPLRGAIEAVLASEERGGRVTILYGARTPADLLFTDDLAAWATARAVEVAVTVDAAVPGWDGHVGVVTRLIERARLDPKRTVAMVCGPEIMMRFAVASLHDRGVDPARVHVSLERNMHCAVALCGHCQLGSTIVCRDGAIYPWPTVEPLLSVREL